MKKYISELIGAFVLTFMGCGSAMFLGCEPSGGMLAVVLCFGLSIVAMAYVIGNVSGCHINPAVSLAVLISGKMSVLDFFGYVVSQVLGAIAAGGLLSVLVSQFKFADNTGALGSNNFGEIGVAGAIIIEVILTFIFIFTILGVTSDEKKGSVAGIVIGLTLAFVHIVGIPLTGTSVNPARSIGPAIFAGGEPLTNLWVFIVAPFAGAILAALVYKLVAAKKDTAEA